MLTVISPPPGGLVLVKNLPGPSQGRVEHILTCVPMSRRFELASGGLERRVFAAHSRRVPSTKAKVLDVPVVPRLWNSIEELSPNLGDGRAGQAAAVVG